MHDSALHSHAQIPFTIGIRLTQFRFPGGLAAAFKTAPGGASGKVLVGTRTKDGVAMAVKALLGFGRESFQAEFENLLALRGKVDEVRALEASGIALSVADTGARHVAYVYGSGDEPDLSKLDPALPRVPASLIVVEPLMLTLTQAFLRPGAPLAPVISLYRAVHEIALALAFTAKHRIVVSVQSEKVSALSFAWSSYCTFAPFAALGHQAR